MPVPISTVWSGGRTFSASQTITDAVTMAPGAVVNITAGTLTFSTSFSAPNVQVFVCTGTGKVMFADGAVTEVRPQWWGFAAGATAAVNDAARLAARDSITLRGTVLFPPGAFPVTAYVPINRNYLRFAGDARFGTVFVPTAGAGDITGVDGTYAPGFVDGPSAPYLDECQHVGIGVYRSDSQTASGTFDATRLPTSIPAELAISSIVSPRTAISMRNW